MLCYITHVMPCYITHNTCYAMLCNKRYVIVYHMLCYVI